MKLKWILIISLLFSALNGEEKDVKSFASELVRLRGEVESLSSEVESKKQDLRQKLKALSMQSAELEASIQKEEIRTKQLEAALSKKRTLKKDDNFDEEKLKEIILKSIGDISESVKKTIPFKQKERIAELNTIKDAVAANAMNPFVALAKLWSFAEDEIRITKENGLFRETLQIEQKEILVDVAKIGTVMMFFKTTDNRVGSALKTSSGYSFVIEKDKEKTEKIALLFDALKKQIRSGFFEIPYALP